MSGLVASVDSCMHCGTTVQTQEQYYQLSDLGEEILKHVEKSHNSMDIFKDILCEECFSGFLMQVNAEQIRIDYSQCCKCHASVRYRKSHALPSGPEKDELAAMMHPRTIPANALVCFRCWVDLRRRIETSGASLSQSMHPRCIDCNLSLSTRPFQVLLDGPEKDIVALKISPREVPAVSRICNNCWVRVKRCVQRQADNAINTSQPSLDYENQANTPENEPEPERFHIAAVAEYENSPARVNEVQGDANPPLEDSPEHNVSASSSNNSIMFDDFDLDSLCIWCGTSLSDIRSHPLAEESVRDEIAASIFPREILNHSRVCHACWVAARHNTERQSATQESDNDSILLTNFKRTSNTSNLCFVPGCTNSERLVIPDYLRKRLLTEYKIYITSNARICQVHKTMYNWDGIEQLPFQARFSKMQVEDMCLLGISNPVTSFLDFENVQNIPHNVFHYWTGRTIEQFLNLMTQVPMLQQTCKKPQLALGLYLLKLKTGDSNARLSSLFQMPESNIARTLNKTRNALIAQFVPRNLGFNRITRESMLQRNLVIPRGLFGDPSNETLISIFDGTYVYLQKSSNYSFQKKSYSLHKYRNLLKTFIVVATDGYILDVFGPYAATTSDADIMKALFQNEGSQMRQFFEQNDAFILDRGFRDAIPLLTSLNYKVFKPESILDGETQLTTIDANKTRCVTLCRWVVEVINGRYKRDYKLFRQEYFNKASTHLMDDFRIGAAIINAYHQVIVDRSDAQLILNRALRYLHTPNHLSEYVVQNNINRRRAQFERIDGVLPEIMFPEMTESDLILFGLGIYQLKQARSYFGEHIRENGGFIIEIASNVQTEIVPGLSLLNCSKLIRGRIKSRHYSGRVYYTYILINESLIQSWEESICGYYCSCVSGKRTVGCCAHIMTIVWYMGWARHQTNIEPPAAFLDDIIVREDVENE